MVQIPRQLDGVRIDHPHIVGDLIQQTINLLTLIRGVRPIDDRLSRQQSMVGQGNPIGIYIHSTLQVDTGFQGLGSRTRRRQINRSKLLKGPRASPGEIDGEAIGRASQLNLIPINILNPIPSAIAQTANGRFPILNSIH